MKHFRDKTKERKESTIPVYSTNFSSEDFDNFLLLLQFNNDRIHVRDHMRKKFSNEDIEYFVTNL